MRKESGNKSQKRIFAARFAGAVAGYVAVFSFTGADPVSFGVCACDRA